MELPKEFVIYDLEYTAWEGSQEREWSGPDEHREIIEIGAIRVKNLEEIDSFRMYVVPTINVELSEYIISLTGITQKKLAEEGVAFKSALTAFNAWCGGLTIVAFGKDPDVLKENCHLNDLSFPFAEDRLLNIRHYFASLGIDDTKFMSSTISTAFNIDSPFREHDGLSDSRSILIALQAAAN